MFRVQCFKAQCFKAQCSEPSQLSVKPGQAWSSLVKPCGGTEPLGFWALDFGPWTLDFGPQTSGPRVTGAYRHSTALNGAYSRINKETFYRRLRSTLPF